ncbi:MAG: efflux RND transporter periplasmic adaptor subunit [Thiobacillus sp.]
MKPRVRLRYSGVLLAVVAGAIGMGYYAGQQQHNSASPIMQSAHAVDRLEDKATPAQKPWVCPMHPQILQDHPGQCPICGMDLVEAASAHSHDGSGVHVDTASLQRMGVRLASVEVQDLSRELQTYGNVAIDESSITNVSPKVEGWIRKLHVTAVGQRVHAGQILYEIYSPDLVQRQREYIELLQRRDLLLQRMTDLSGQNAQVAASLARERIRSREKFAYADVGKDILDEIEKTHRTVDVVPVRASASGFVRQIGARVGSYVSPATDLLSLADTATVWIDIVLYPDQLEWVKEGDDVTVKLPHSDALEVKGRLKFASPLLDDASRTMRARLVVNNAHRQLRPGSFVDVVIAASPRKALALPRSAVMRTGRGTMVMLARGDGYFIPFPVETGIENSELVEITEGLQEGAQVAVNGQFLLDAAASLSDAAQRMQGDH